MNKAYPTRPILILLLTSLIFGSVMVAQESSSPIDAPNEMELNLPGDVTSSTPPARPEWMGLAPETAAAAQGLASPFTTAEWLGPLAPVALSPFFALTLLSGVALYGGEWLGDDHALLQAAGPLNNSTVFWTFLVLTVVTSIPKFSKISKPFAQVVDKIEAFAGIIVIIALRVAAGEADVDPQLAQNTVMFHAGVFTFTGETLLTIAMLINFFMIHSIKFFFELLIWITPVPLLDGIFEIGNKATCAGLMALYAFSPPLATLINLILFALCALIFTWVRRRELYYRTLIFDAVRDWLKYPTGNLKSISVFPLASIGAIPSKSRCQLAKTDNGWRLSCPRLFRPPLEHHFTNSELKITKGWFTTKFDLEGDVVRLIGSQRYHKNLPEIATELGGQLQQSESIGDWRALKADLA